MMFNHIIGQQRYENLTNHRSMQGTQNRLFMHELHLTTLPLSFL